MEVMEVFIVMEVIMYEVEIWRWRERKVLEIIQKKYVK